MKSKILVSSLTLAASLSTIQAAITAQDSFLIGSGQYTLGNLNGQNPTTLGFSGAWSGFGAADVVSSNLSSAVNDGGSVSVQNGTRFSRLLSAGPTISETTVGTYYIGFTLQVSSANYQAVEFGFGTSNDSDRSIQVGASTTDFSLTNLGLRINDTNTLQLASNMAFNTNVNQYVLRLDLLAAPNSDSIRLFLNPSDLSNEANNSSTVLSGFEFGGIDRVALANFSADGLNTGVDEIRFASTFAEAVPEPSSSLLLLGALGGMTLIRRRNA